MNLGVPKGETSVERSLELLERMDGGYAALEVHSEVGLGTKVILRFSKELE